MKKKILYIVCSIFILFICFIIFDNFNQKRILKNEVNTFSKKDISKDRFNTPIKTHGNYAVVEKTIKKFLDDYAVSFQNVSKVSEDKILSNMLLADNYKNDGPYFEKSYKYLNDKKLSFDNDMDILIEYCNERNIKKMIKNKNLSDYYVNLYDSLMLNDNMTKDFEDSRLLLEDYKNNMDKLFDNTKAVLDYLFTQKGNWEIQDDKILFKENSMIDQYNLLISKVNNKTNN